MVGTMIGTKILKRVGLNLFQGTKKLKMALLKELLRDCHRVSNHSSGWLTATDDFNRYPLFQLAIFDS